MYLPARYNIDVHDYSVRLKAASQQRLLANCRLALTKISKGIAAD